MMKNRNRLPEGHAPTEQRGAPVTTRAPVLSLSVDRPCGWSVLAASGEIDTACAGTLRSLLAVAGPNVVVDLREVTFMDASGLGVLATSGHIARRLGGEVRLVARAPGPPGAGAHLLDRSRAGLRGPTRIIRR